MSWYETHAVDYVFGLARNEQLRVQIESEMQAAGLYAATGKPARVFTVKRENFRWADLVQGDLKEREVKCTPQNWILGAVFEVRVWGGRARASCGVRPWNQRCGRW